MKIETKATMDTREDVLAAMLRIRAFETKLEWLYSKGMLGGTSHLCIGQEASAVGVIHRLKPDDYVVSSHRGHGHMIAKGGDIGRMFGELLGKSNGYCGGKGGSQHLCAKEIGFYGTNGITAGGIPIATGLALAAKLDASPKIGVAFFGDGATAQGTFHESLNIAALWGLPIMYVCENNLYSMSTPLSRTSSVQDLTRKAGAYDIESGSVDGTDVVAVREIARRAVDYVRGKSRPFLLEVKTYRHCGHSKSDPRVYRSKEEEQEWKDRDCIESCKSRLLDDGYSAMALEELQRGIEREVDDALNETLQIENAPLDTALKGVYGDERV
jgi:TPP-dependent pyruvate/acetoin dehydrogenase alpha subunit